MARKLLKGFLYFLAFLLIASICVIVPLDRSPYHEFIAYADMNERLDSLEREYRNPQEEGSLLVGFASVSITPDQVTPLAGYGARKPKEFDQILKNAGVTPVKLPPRSPNLKGYAS